ncbi:MAG: hypothetical protein EAZ91_09265 [Cytophagales bacterium]|nr:MAG: hypothetical protein EAZ91_09265 [Cytophagales bacterium]
MKRALFRVVNVLMAVVVLLSSTGFGLVEHSCQMRGKKITRVGMEQLTCVGCPPAAPKASASSTKPSVKKTDCCEDEQRYENVDVTSSLSQLMAKFFKTVANAVVSGVTMLVAALFNWLFSTDASVVAHSPNAPPDAYGRALLTLVQSFLI